MTSVSVVIPTFNRAQKVLRAASSVLYQKYTDYEIIVVDDGSTDDSTRILGQFSGRIRLIRHPVNRGVSAARNTGIGLSKGSLIAFLDSDDYWLPEKLGTQMAFFDENTEAVACQTEEVWVRKGRRVNPRHKHMKPTGDIFRPSLKHCLVSPSAVMLKRSVLDEEGLFDENLPACEDYDLWLRIAYRYPIHLIKRPLVVKEGGSPDQLSARFAGMDRFRIKAMLKLIGTGKLNSEQIQLTLKELDRKCRIYGNGCLKRGKKEEGALYLRLPEIVKSEISPQGLPLDLEPLYSSLGNDPALMSDMDI
jgi:glycosyltransferase involved in cell wall biosynthesis